LRDSWQKNYLGDGDAAFNFWGNVSGEGTGKICPPGEEEDYVHGGVSQDIKKRGTVGTSAAGSGYFGPTASRESIDEPAPTEGRRGKST